tara:strand:- start:372 stop:746 length:375 start_codon:yes stop_codon:yes gene_type:complete
MNKQIIYFLIIGSTGVLIDYLVYLFLLSFVPINISKILGFISGAAFNFFMNRKLTFAVSDFLATRLIKFSFLYAFTLFLNVSVNQLSLELLSSNNYKIHIAFILATGTSTAVNFIGQKFWVFKK